MKRIGFIIFATLLLGATMLSAKGAEVYKRKTVKPNFFMPEAPVAKKDKLPPFPALEKGLIKVTEEGIVMKRVYRPKQDTARQNAAKGAFKKNISQKSSSNAEEISEYLPSDGLGDNLSKDSGYMAKIKAYEDDMMTFARTKNMPKNSQLETDLKKMNSEVPFRVD